MNLEHCSVSWEPYKSTHPSNILNKSWKGIDMYHLAASAAIAFTWFTMATSQLPCNSQLRLIPVFSYLFTHCECSYSEWTEWVPISSTPVPSTQCPSERALTEERRQRVLSGDCDDRTEEKVICKFSVHGFERASILWRFSVIPCR